MKPEPVGREQQDPLTGILHRPAFARALRSALEDSRTAGPAFAVVIVDLDRFRVVNDSLGPSGGDELLRLVADRLGTAFGSGAQLARMGGDEFGFLLLGCDGAVGAEDAARRVAQLFESTFVVAGHEIFATASVGIALATSRHASADDLLRDAESATYRAKARGRARHEIFEPVLQARPFTPLQLETDLRQALARGEFRLRYQPIVSLETGHVSGFEALLRWQHPTRGLLAPDTFLSLAEDTGLILPIGTWVIQESCRQVNAWRKKLRNQFQVDMSVNLSARQFSQPNLVTELRGALDAQGLPGSSLLLEITESVLMDDPEAARRTLATLRGLQVRLVLDDFGTGYSSLSHLHEFPIDMFKIDRSFVARMGEDGANFDLVRTIVHLARHLSMSVVAEGVETEGQLGRLRTLRCDGAQGFYFSPAVTPDAAEQILTDNPKW